MKIKFFILGFMFGVIISGGVSLYAISEITKYSVDEVLCKVLNSSETALQIEF